MFKGSMDIAGKVRRLFKRPVISVFHERTPAPGGGGHQFMRALTGEFQRRGLRVEWNKISKGSRTCLFNSFNFDFDRLREMHRDGCRMVHRVDGPVGAYRGFDDGTDDKICRINEELADVTVFQSRYSLEKHLELGLRFKSPVVVMNAVDPRIFNARDRINFDPSRKIRLIAASWSDNPNKGADVYRWLEDHLDWSRFEFTFVGRSPVSFKRIRLIAPVDSVSLASYFRHHDIYLTASRSDTCSNCLLEAMACGLPAIYHDSGGHPEIAGEAGLGFERSEEIPRLIEQMILQYRVRQSRIAIPDLGKVCDRYLDILGLREEFCESR